ncbi:MAG: ROK family protein [bacterium]
MSILALDFGGTKIKYGLIEKDYLQFQDNSITTPSGGQFSQTVEALDKLFQKFSEVKAVGIGFPGIVDFKKQTVRFSPNTSEWEGKNISRVLREKWNVPVVVDNDANLFTYAESKIGAGQKCSHVLGITLGTGVGSGVVINNEIYRGVNGAAGELGHTVVVPEGPLCSCGRRGCLESLVGKKAMQRDLAGYIQQGIATSCSKSCSPEEIYNQGLKGDLVALEIFRKLSIYLGIALANAVNFFDFDGIVLGGGISSAYRLFIEDLKFHFKHHLINFSQRQIKIYPSQLKSRAALIGAGLLAEKLLS